MKYAYYNYPTWVNPYIDKAWLKETKETLYKRGEGYIFEQEYAAKPVYGGADNIFPMFDESHVWDHATLMREKIKKDAHKLEWYVQADPGTSTCFAMIFAAVNIYKKELYLLDEIYETSQKETTTSQIIPRKQAVQENLFPDWDDWFQCYDEAASWFAAEAAASFGEGWTPTAKRLLGRDKPEEKAGLSVCKDQLLHYKVYFSDRMKNMIKEIKRYKKDDNGKIPKVDDHTIDCWRYLNQAAGLDLVDMVEPEKDPYHEGKRAYTFEDDLDFDDPTNELMREYMQ